MLSANAVRTFTTTPLSAEAHAGSTMAYTVLPVHVTVEKGNKNGSLVVLYGDAHVGDEARQKSLLRGEEHFPQSEFDEYCKWLPSTLRASQSEGKPAVVMVESRFWSINKEQQGKMSAAVEKETGTVKFKTALIGKGANTMAAAILRTFLRIPIRNYNEGDYAGALKYLGVPVSTVINPLIQVLSELQNAIDKVKKG